MAYGSSRGLELNLSCSFDLCLSCSNTRSLTCCATVGTPQKRELLWKIVWWSHKQIKHRITIWSSNSPSRYVLPQIESRVSKRYLYTHVHISMTDNRWKVEAIGWPSADEWIHKCGVYRQWNTRHPWKGRTLTRATAWMNLEEVMVSETSQSQKGNCYMILFPASVSFQQGYSNS